MMVLNQEKLKILTMVQEGKLTAEQAARLMDALEGPATPARPRPAQPATAEPPTREHAPRWIRVQVTDTNTGKSRVNVRLPINLVQAGFKMGARFSPEVQGLDQEQLMQIIKSGETGKIVDVLDEQDGEHVEVFIE
jgi:hypothetical protein